MAEKAFIKIGVFKIWGAHLADCVKPIAMCKWEF